MKPARTPEGAFEIINNALEDDMKIIGIRGGRNKCRVFIPDVSCGGKRTVREVTRLARTAFGFKLSRDEVWLVSNSGFGTIEAVAEAWSTKRGKPVLCKEF